jgi:hypothetical protein
MGQLGNGVYTNGNKGSNFSFELKTLKALEQIAILIEAGGAVPGSQNLQDVTTLGNETNMGIRIVEEELQVKTSKTFEKITVTTQHIEFTQESGSKGQLQFVELDTNRQITLPNIDGTLVTSVNGITPDAAGNVVLPYEPQIVAGQTQILGPDTYISVYNDAISSNSLIFLSYATQSIDSNYPPLVANPNAGYFVLVIAGSTTVGKTYTINYMIVNS